MSILHVNQIAGALQRMFGGFIDMADGVSNPDDSSKLFRSRALAAFAIAQLVGISPEDAAKAVTDGSSDNGIDALYYDRASKTMYVVQSKWHGDGNGSFDRGDMLKFTKGFEDLVQFNFDRFNPKLTAKKSMIEEALHDDQAKYVLVLIHTGLQDLATEPRQDLEDCLNPPPVTRTDAQVGSQYGRYLPRRHGSAHARLPAAPRGHRGLPSW
jgi:hypothetical protein